jgi:hypothetical protein
MTPTGVAISRNHRPNRHAPEEFGNSAGNIDIPIIADCKSMLQQLSEAIAPGPTWSLLIRASPRAPGTADCSARKIKLILRIN